MRRFSFMTAFFLGVALIVVPSAYGGTLSATWTGNKATDYSVFPAETVGRPLDSVTNTAEDLPNTDGRIGGTEVVYGNQIICGGVYHGVSTGGCETESDQTVCDGVDVLSYSDVDGAVTSVDPIFEDADCALTDERRGPEDELPNERLICNNFVLPAQCELKDVIGFKPLGKYQGVADVAGDAEGTEQRIFLPEPPGHETIMRGDFSITIDMAMTDMHTQGGWYYSGPLVFFLATDNTIHMHWNNWGNTPDKYIWRSVIGTGTIYNDETLGWDPLLAEPEAGALSMRLEMVDGVVTGSFKAPGGAWTEIINFDMADVPHIDLEKGYRIGFNNRGEADKTFWIDEIRVELTTEDLPVIELVEGLGAAVNGIVRVLYPTYWVERGGTFVDPGATAAEFDDMLAAVDVTDAMVITSWGRRDEDDEGNVAPEDVVTGTGAVDVNYPDEYVIAYNFTDSQGRSAAEVRRRVVVYEEGHEWAEYNGHWYKLDPPTSYLDHRARAKKMGGYVTTISDKEENFWIADTFREPTVRMMGLYDNWPVEIGLTDLIVTGVYQWDNGDPVDYVNWVNDEPNNWGPDQGWGPEHNAIIHMGGPVGWERYGYWYDYDDDACCPLPNWGWMTEETRYKPAILEVETDPLPPQITLLGAKAKSLGLGSAYIEEGATALDNVDGDLTDDIAITSPLDVNAPGEYLVSYAVTDAAGNKSATVTRTVFVTFGSDTRPPQVTLLGCVGAAGDPCMNLLNTGEVYEEPGTDAFDDYDLDAVDVAVITYSLSAMRLDANKAGNISFVPCLLGAGCLSEIDLSSADAGDGAVVMIGMKAYWYVLVESPESPNSKLIWQEEKVVDIVDGDQLVAPIDTSVDGVYVSKYNAADAAGNAADEIDRLVVVKDSPPLIAVTGDIFTGVRVGGTYEELGASASDIEDENDDVSAAIVIASDVDTDTLGEYTVTYNVTDSAGNAAVEQTRNVTVFEAFEKQLEDQTPETVTSFCFIGTISPN